MSNEFITGRRRAAKTETKYDSRKWLLFLRLVAAFVVGVAVTSIFYSRSALCSDVPCDHFNVRVRAIENIIQQSGGSPRYLALGDSITEWAALPEICGRKPINAGIVAATVTTFEELGRRLADLTQPDFIVVALGTNDALRHRVDGFQVRLSALISSLNLWPVIVVPLTPGDSVSDVTKFNAAIEALPVPKASTLEHIETTDGIHLTTASYATWKDSIVRAASKFICP